MRISSLGLLILHLVCGFAGANTLQVITATWAPYNMEENGKLIGIGTEIVQATLEKADIEADIKIYPWARAYRKALNEPNTMVYTVIKIPERESLFKWVGPIIPVKSVLHKLKKRSDIIVKSLADVKKYKVGTTRNAAGHQFLVKRGFEEKKHIHLENTNERSVQLLFKERVDLESSVELNFMYEAKRQGYSYSDVEQAFVLFENEGYIAFNSSTPDELVDRIRSAFEEVKAAGTVDLIVNKYLRYYQ